MLSASMIIALRLLDVSAQIIRKMTFTQIMAIWTTGRSPQDHLNKAHGCQHLKWMALPNPFNSLGLSYGYENKLVGGITFI